MADVPKKALSFSPIKSDFKAYLLTKTTQIFIIKANRQFIFDVSDESFFRSVYNKNVWKSDKSKCQMSNAYVDPYAEQLLFSILKSHCL